MGKKTHIFSTDKLSKAKQERANRFNLQKLIAEHAPVNKAPDSSGVMNTNVVNRNINYIMSPNDTKIASKPDGSSGVFLATDRPSTLSSGYGGKGAQDANAIDMVVGRAAGTKVKDGAHVHPSFAGDAARIYISQLTDIDLNFGIVEGRGGYLKGRSAIGIKADGVRIIGREGVKITTGRAFAFKAGPGGEKNSRGGKISQPAPPIELIAGNNDSEREVFGGIVGSPQRIRSLQGVGKGDNIRDCVQELSKMLEEIISAVYNLTLMQLAYNSINGIDFWRPWMGGVGVTTSTAFLTHVQNSLWHTRINKILWEINYTYPFGYKFIPSRNVFAN